MLTRSALIEPAMRPVPVVTRLVLGKHAYQVSVIEDEQAIQAVTAHRADPSLGVAVRWWGLRWAWQCLDSDIGEHRVQAGRERGIALTDKKPEAVGLLGRSDEKVAGLLGSPTPPVGLPVTPRM
jgi:hypothetical protein